MKKNKYSLYWKIITTILAVGLLPLAGGMLWAGLYGRSMLLQASGVKFAELAKQLATHIDFVLDREIHEAQSLALSEDLRQAVEAGPSNQERAAFSGAASKYLKAYQGLKEGEYAAIYATDRRGRTVASTGPLDRTDYTGENWWKRAFHDGEGAIYISDLYVLPGEDRLGIDLALPILDLQTRQAVGVLKLIIKDLDLGEILQEVKIGETGHAMLVGAQGRVLFCPLIPAAAH